MDEKKMIREKLVKMLERGKESATQMRRLIHHHHHHQDLHDDGGEWLKLLKGQVEARSVEVLTSFATVLSMIHYSFPSFDDHDHRGLKRPNPTLKSQVPEDSWEAPRTPKDARGSYKRR